jgi:hypothetical protein
MVCGTTLITNIKAADDSILLSLDCVTWLHEFTLRVVLAWKDRLSTSPLSISPYRLRCFYVEVTVTAPNIASVPHFQQHTHTSPKNTGFCLTKVDLFNNEASMLAYGYVQQLASDSNVIQSSNKGGPINDRPHYSHS